jgi:hypothetical protein
LESKRSKVIYLLKQLFHQAYWELSFGFLLE